jgi:hypothetical protein
MQLKYLCLLFGIIPSCASAYILKMMKLVIKSLKKHPDARIEWPSPQRMEVFAQMVAARQPEVQNIIGLMVE